MRTLYILLTMAVLISTAPLRAQQYPFQNPMLSDDERVDNLLSLLTLEEKINALSTNLGVPRLGIRSTGHSEGLHGVALGGPGNWGDFNNKVNPRTYPTTTFPQAYGLGATWDVELLQRIADWEATELRYYTQHPDLQKGGLVMRAPNADLARDPRWGRTEESFGEDAFLTARMTVAFVKGLQGNDPRYWKSASLMKHFLANSNEDGRDSCSSDFDEVLFREYYSYPFYKGITEGGSQAFMAAYNAWNGIPMTIHPVLQEVTRKEWGNKGIICTDGGALRLLHESHKTFPSLAECAAAVVKAGVGQFLDNYRPAIHEALEKGLLTEDDINKAIWGNFYVALKLGLLEAENVEVPYASIGLDSAPAPWTTAEASLLVREATAKSVVLLKNSKALLPLDATKLKSIAVIGPRADEVLLDWYSGTPPYTVTIREGISKAVGEGTTVYYAPSNRMDEAIKTATRAEVAIVCVGNHPYGTNAAWKVSPVPSDGREAVDRQALTLEQEDLVRQVYQANPNTVLVLVSNFPYAINWSQENLPAIVNLTNNSQELGNGLADVLFGKVNPAGRTTQTWVKSITDLPPIMDYDIRNGRTYQYFTGTALYPFGHGLSYTSFEYKDLRLVPNAASDTLWVKMQLTNTGKLKGEEVVQVYIHAPDLARDPKPIKQLKAFGRIAVAPSETREVSLPVPFSELTNWSVEEHKFVPLKGRLQVMVGASSTDIRLNQQIKL